MGDVSSIFSTFVMTWRTPKRCSRNTHLSLVFMSFQPLPTLNASRACFTLLKAFATSSRSAATLSRSAATAPIWFAKSSADGASVSFNTGRSSTFGFSFSTNVSRSRAPSLPSNFTSRIKGSAFDVINRFSVKSAMACLVTSLATIAFALSSSFLFPLFSFFSMSSSIKCFELRTFGLEDFGRVEEDGRK